MIEKDFYDAGDVKPVETPSGAGAPPPPPPPPMPTTITPMREIRDGEAKITSLLL
jgi:hypothetical protein